jgi:hypothetical protein
VKYTYRFPGDCFSSRSTFYSKGIAFTDKTAPRTVCELMNDGTRLYMRRFEKGSATDSFVWLPYYGGVRRVLKPDEKKYSTANLHPNEALHLCSYGHDRFGVATLILDFFRLNESSKSNIHVWSGLHIRPWRSTRVELASKGIVEHYELEGACVC